MKELSALALFALLVGCSACSAPRDEALQAVTFPEGKPTTPQHSAGADTHAPTKWSTIGIGMTQDEVRTLLGEPKTAFPSPSRMARPVARSLLQPDDWWPERVMMATALAINPATYGGSKGYHEGWEYPRDSGPVFRPSYYVYFDASGKVVRFSAPDDPDQQPLVQISEAPLDKLIPLWEETTGITVEYDPVLVQDVTANIEGIEDPHMLEPRVREACEQSGLQLRKASTDEKTGYTIMKKEPANKMPGHVP